MTDSDEQKIHEEDIKRKQMDKEMREKEDTGKNTIRKS